HRARGDRAPPHGRARRRDLVHHQPRRWPLGDQARPCRGRGHREPDPRALRGTALGLGTPHRRGSARMIDWAKLELAALAVQKHAHAPYSHYAVGAALQTASGAVFAGCNVENASYGLAVCAERSAVVQMIAAGERDPVAMVVVTPGPMPGTPCGACRQTL